MTTLQTATITAALIFGMCLALLGSSETRAGQAPEPWRRPHWIFAVRPQCRAYSADALGRPSY